MAERSTARTFDGVVLAGGYSRRFGDPDKALVELGGKPLVAHVVQRIDRVADDVVVNCRQEQVDGVRDALAGVDVPVQFAPDPEPDRGPLFGILTGLAATDDEYAAVVACDMPFVDPDFLAYLREECEGHDAAVPRDEDGWYNPTQAVYRREPTVEAARWALESPDGDGRIMDALDRMDVVSVSPEAVRARAAEHSFLDVNTPEDLRTAESLLD